MNLLEYMLDLYEQSPEFKLDEINFEEDIKFSKNNLDSQKVQEYIDKHPGDPIGELGRFFVKYQQTRPLHEWDVQRMLDISAVTQPFLDEVRKRNPHIETKAELDGLTGTTACLSVILPEYIPFDAGKDLLKCYKAVVQKSDAISITQMVGNRINLELYFEDVRKPMK